MNKPKKVESFRMRDSTRKKLNKLYSRYRWTENFPPTKTAIYNRAIEEFCDRELRRAKKG